MSMDVLPTEILIEIFQYLDGPDVYKCRRVCKRWNYIIDDFKDTDWREYCLKDFHYVMDVYKHSRLTWCELYKSLYQWPKIKSAKMSAHRFPIQSAQHFQLIGNGIVAVCEDHSNDIINILWGYSDTIVYYNTYTFAETDRFTPGFPFSAYKENDHLICLVQRTGSLCVIVKQTKKKYIVGELPLFENCQPGEYSLIGSSVYFQTASDTLNRAQLKLQNDELIIETKTIDDFVDLTVIAINSVGNDRLFILTDEVNQGVVYEYVNKDIGMGGIIDSNYTIYELGEYGFDWTEPAILHWMFRTFKKDILRITKLKISSVCSFGTSIVLGTYRRMINIYARPYTPRGELVLYNAKPDLSINMNEIYRPVSPFREIQQVDVIEVKNGHKLIVLTDDQLFSIDFVHEKKRKRVNNADRDAGIVKIRKMAPKKPKTQGKRRPRTTATKEQRQKSPRSKAAPSTSTTHKHRYQTRSKKK